MVTLVVESSGHFEKMIDTASVEVGFCTFKCVLVGQRGPRAVRIYDKIDALQRKKKKKKKLNKTINS